MWAVMRVLMVVSSSDWAGGCAILRRSCDFVQDDDDTVFLGWVLLSDVCYYSPVSMLDEITVAGLSDSIVTKSVLTRDQYPEIILY